ncbi:MAG: 1,4-dihydroxy-2-naphthoate polyprenyltransferase [Polyangiaceae bacterium]
MNTTLTVSPGGLRAWLLAIRPRTLPAAASPIFVGSAVAWRLGGFHWGAALASLVGALLLQIASNLANDVFDFEQGKDTHERLGPVRVVQSGLLSPFAVRRGLLGVLVLSLLVGCYLVGKAGWPIVIVGLASMLAAVAYTAGPFPLGYNGLGDLFVFIFFGPVAVIGTAFVQTEWVAPEAVWASIPVGALTANILVVNNLRDRNEDQKTGKRTLVVRFGKQFAMRQAQLSLLVAFLIPLGFAWVLHRPWPVVLPLFILPASLGWLRAIEATEGRPMNEHLARAAKLLLAHSALFSLGLVLSP